MSKYDELMKMNGLESIAYGERVTKLIREKYSVNDELAILRQRDSKPEEFEEYNEFAEECKKKAKEVSL